MKNTPGAASRHFFLSGRTPSLNSFLRRFFFLFFFFLFFFSIVAVERFVERVQLGTLNESRSQFGF